MLGENPAASDEKHSTAYRQNRPLAISHFLNSFRRTDRTTSKQGFTLIEMLIAMAITLLMMAAVARAFAFVGERVRDSRGNVSLSSELRDVTTRLNDELRNCTVSLKPVTGDDPEPNGYFEYYEGPMTDATTTIFGGYSDKGAIDGLDESPLASRFGDLDDYLAFTAIAPPGAWFTGQVPAYVLDTSLASSVNTPVVIRSRYAEIVYFVNPERDGTGKVVDADGDSIADRLMLYRRVLLIRPDLNLVTGGTVSNLFSGSNPLTGMAGAHQLADLSIRRQLNANGTPNLNNNVGVIANSLADLAQPHNRFGHVRLGWGQIVGGTSSDFSMPMLALEDLDTNDLIMQGVANSLSPPQSATGNAPVVTPRYWSGYLRRDFVLAGNRRGEDVVANNVRALDVQIFDPKAAFYLSSTGLVVGPSDAAYRDVLNDTAIRVPGGGFVDLAYPVLAGGATRGWGNLKTWLNASTTPGVSATTHNNLINMQQSDFSGLDFGSATVFPPNASTKTYTDSLMKSGRLVISNNQIRLLQPAFDTYTSSYERDGYYQNRRYDGTLFQGTNWEIYDTADASITDLAADGIDTASALFPGEYGTDDASERETSAPFTATPRAIRVTIRLENVGTRQLRQLSVVHGGSL